jgi:hypothetical protein
VSLFFWGSIAMASGSWLWLVGQARSGAVEVTTGWVLLAALLGLAIVEHLIMMFPLPLQKLWGWAMGTPAAAPAVATAAVPAMPGASGDRP